LGYIHSFSSYIRPGGIYQWNIVEQRRSVIYWEIPIIDSIPSSSRVR
jgi:hypothetical protein